MRVRELEDGVTVASLRDARALIAGREAEAALAEAEERYRGLVEQIPAVVYADDGNVTTYVNPQIEHILGVTPQAYRDDPEHVAAHGASGRPGDGRGRRARRSSTAIGGDLADYRMIRPDGGIVWVRDRAYAHRDDDGRVLWEHGILFDVTELKEAEARIAHMAFHDGLTGLANRELFEETLALAVRAREARRDGGRRPVPGPGQLQAGERLARPPCRRPAADRARATGCSACTRDTDLVARQGGDEFLMLLADLEPRRLRRGDPGRHRPRVRGDGARRSTCEGTEFYARGSIGISVHPHDAHDVETLMRNADVAMYRAKRLDPGGHAFFAADADDAQDRLSFATRLRQAVEDESWLLHYQPVVDLADRRIVGAEALIRWDDVAAGIVPPGEFIPVAEELGLIEAIGDWVVDEVARQQRRWIDAGLQLEVSFNLSPRQMWTPRLGERLIGKLHDAGVDPSCMQAEITETSAMADPERTQRILRELHGCGLRLALDDFGTGYSSLARLKHMPVDVLKIDREFVRHVDKDVRLAGMVRAMIQVAQSLDMVPLAEGVETEGEYIFLRSNGCRLAQGFWFAHPMVARDFERLATSGEPLGPSTI